MQDSVLTIHEVEVTARPLQKQVSAITPAQQMDADELSAIAAHTAADAACKNRCKNHINQPFLVICL